MEQRMKEQLEKRRKDGTLRSPLAPDQLSSNNLDFSSNDYLGLARCTKQAEMVEEDFSKQSSSLGATGSRLLSGDSRYCRNLERWLARLHNRETATLFNSGYDANLSVLSSLILPGDHILLDELCHNSLVMGVRMSRQREFHTFRHNNVHDLRTHLECMHPTGERIIVVESVYSMDGDIAPLGQILDVAGDFKATVIVDEAHGLGVYGRSNPNSPLGTPQEYNALSVGGTGVLAAYELERHKSLLCSIYTFGKAAGCHGAVVCGSQVLRDFLWNYARPFVYSTASPLHSLVCVQQAYRTMTGKEGEIRRQRLFRNIRIFRQRMAQILPSDGAVGLWPSTSPIQALIVPGNETCIELCRVIQRRRSIQLYPIRAPTVPKGQERVRIVLHSHNEVSEIEQLIQAIGAALHDTGLAKNPRL